MYSALLATHSLLRWFVVFAVLLAVIRGVAGIRSGRPFTAADEKVGLFGMIGLDAQLLTGLVLYFFLSPLAHSARTNLGAAMRANDLRYWGVEHVAMMVLAAICLHLGKIKSGRAAGDTARHRALATYYGIALLVILAAMPWPFRADIGRPLLPF